MRFVGVDPGKSGAIALLSPTSQRVVTWAMPLTRYETGGRPRTRVDLYELGRIAEHILSDYDDQTTVTIEQVEASPQMGRTSAFTFGEVAMAAEAIWHFHNMTDPGRIIVKKVRPAVWKVKMGLAGAAKRESCDVAAEAWPRDRAQFFGARGAPQDGRAEAALLAVYGEHVYKTAQMKAERGR